VTLEYENISYYCRYTAIRITLLKIKMAGEENGLPECDTMDIGR
jgi:hypothetical protein